MVPPLGSSSSVLLVLAVECRHMLCSLVAEVDNSVLFHALAHVARGAKRHGECAEPTFMQEREGLRGPAACYLVYKRLALVLSVVAVVFYFTKPRLLASSAASLALTITLYIPEPFIHGRFEQKQRFRVVLFPIL